MCVSFATPVCDYIPPSSIESGETGGRELARYQLPLAEHLCPAVYVLYGLIKWGGFFPNSSALYYTVLFHTYLVNR